MNRRYGWLMSISSKRSLFATCTTSTKFGRLDFGECTTLNSLSLSLSVSICLYLSLSVSICLYLSIYILSIHLCIYLCIYLYTHILPCSLFVVLSSSWPLMCVFFHFIRFYIKGVRTGTFFNGRNGRPLLLDKKSILTILEQLYQNPNMSTNDLRTAVRNEFKESTERKYQVNLPEGGEIPFRRMPHTTVLRYCRKLQGWSAEYAAKKAQDKKKLRQGQSGAIDPSDPSWDQCSIM